MPSDVNETELAWAAGFFEGEGCIYVPPLSQGRGLRLSVYQSGDGPDTPPPSLVRFQRIVGVGHVTKRPPDRLSRKQRWQWRVQRREEAWAVLTALGPYMTTTAWRNVFARN